jgi:hypothetical protein
MYQARRAQLADCHDLFAAQSLSLARSRFITIAA